MARPKKPPHQRVMKDGFSAPRFLSFLAKAAADVDKGKDFSPWMVRAIEEKLERDHKGLAEKMRLALDRLQAESAHGLVREAEASAMIDELVARAIALEQKSRRGAGGGGEAGTPTPYPTRPRAPGLRKKKT